MYEAFYNLKRRPFAAAPQVEVYFPGAAVEAARGDLLRCLQRGEGIGLIVGPTGTGKTLLCQVLAAQCRGTWRVATLACGRLSTRRSLFQAILFELGQAYRGLDEGELRLALLDFLTLGKDPCQGLALFVDEAQTLPLRLLDEIRLLTNLARGGQPLVRVLLAGNGILEERLASPKLDSFHQRIATRCYLEAYSRSETADYIRFQIQAAGGKDRDLFSGEACQSVYRATDGVPRLINQLCDHVLLAAYASERQQIGPEDVEEAWSDLQQLPTPWNASSSSAANNVIEFGRLEEGTDETGAAVKEEELPPLRLAEEAEEANGLAGPERQISTIENLLTEADDDFQPAGTIGPEIELVFAEVEDPFQEEFAEEEQVSDRYVTPPAAESPPAEPAPQFIEPEPPPAEQAPPEASPPETPSIFLQNEGWETVALEPSDAAAMCRPPSELALLEEDRTEPVSPIPEQTESPARRREFRRLFAKLRQG
ncbi:MAG: AAA family ATPase [Pirellulales bacterium]|nr:AAA family ATPase [Pirellulales bacterium]